MALDGTESFAAQAMPGAHWSQRPVTSVHQAIPPVLVAPGHPAGIPLAPEGITPQAGHAQQDCEQGAATRWMERQGGRYRSVTLLGAALSCKQPVGDLVLHHDGHFILVCKPESHTTL